uniref:Uncharacterized protein n=1 Tax=Ananas comosus var. bracteatus TaxID=296719 RepID=A0A6V7PSA1_ANACO|nr:unnamed protein product [Ananas comosus var. bracteatus]
MAMANNDNDEFHQFSKTTLLCRERPKLLFACGSVSSWTFTLTCRPSRIFRSSRASSIPTLSPTRDSRALCPPPSPVALPVPCSSAKPAGLGELSHAIPPPPPTRSCDRRSRRARRVVALWICRSLSPRSRLSSFSDLRGSSPSRDRSELTGPRALSLALAPSRALRGHGEDLLLLLPSSSCDQQEELSSPRTLSLAALRGHHRGGARRSGEDLLLLLSLPIV